MFGRRLSLYILEVSFPDGNPLLPCRYLLRNERAALGLLGVQLEENTPDDIVAESACQPIRSILYTVINPCRMRIW